MTNERGTPHSEAWGPEARKETMRKVVARLAREFVLNPDKAPAIAATYGVPVCAVEAEMMRNLTEDGEGK